MEEVGYKYLMTSRSSQDKIEILFDIVRAAKGCNDHPTCCNARPRRGSNVETEVVNALILPPKSSVFPETNPLQSIKK